ncbi:MAG: hypothetical protein JSS49_22500 [Planctomycetes bacterium]|nr:hypothetical protein [Planctomycetota bacterium]
MLRRRFLGILAAAASAIAAIAILFRRPPPEPEFPRLWIPESDETGWGFGPDSPNRPVKSHALQGELFDRIARELPQSYVMLDPLTLLTLVGIIMQVLRCCSEAAVLRQRDRVLAQPAGAAARRIRQRLEARYRAEHEPRNDFHDHLTAALTAFGKSTPAELVRLRTGLIECQSGPTLIIDAELARELSEDAQ